MGTSVRGTSVNTLLLQVTMLYIAQHFLAFKGSWVQVSNINRFSCYLVKSHNFSGSENRLAVAFSMIVQLSRIECTE